MIYLKCPFCFFDESKVVDSRSTDDNTTIRRRRECSSCGRRYTTYEKIEDIPILVVKRDSTRENFNKEKIVNGLIIACQKRPISRKQIEELAEDIEKSISNNKGWFSKEDDIEIPWDKIVKIGVDVIIVDATGIEITQQDENKI